MFRVKRVNALKDNTNLVYEDFLQLLISNLEVRQAYETLLSSLQLLNSTRPIKTVLVTSAQPGEGKTTVTVNLVLAMVLAGKKVLLLDTDLRRPRIHQIFKLKNMVGFSDILTGSLAVQDVIQIVEIANDAPENRQPLSVMTSGRLPKNINAMGSPNLKESIEHLRNVYNIVLLDSSPTLSVSDTVLLAPMVDGIILVLNTGAVNENDAKRTKEQLERAGGHILGIAMNRFNQKHHGPGFHPYYNYYHQKTIQNP